MYKRKLKTLNKLKAFINKLHIFISEYNMYLPENVDKIILTPTARYCPNYNYLVGW